MLGPVAALMRRISRTRYGSKPCALQSLGAADLHAPARQERMQDPKLYRAVLPCYAARAPCCGHRCGSLGRVRHVPNAGMQPLLMPPKNHLSLTPFCCSRSPARTTPPRSAVRWRTASASACPTAATMRAWRWRPSGPRWWAHSAPAWASITTLSPCRYVASASVLHRGV